MNPDMCAPPASPGLADTLLAETDCRAFGLVERGYAALSAPGGATAAALTGLMVVAVALFGYRLLLGRGFALSDMMALAVRLGVVILIAASWASWQTLAYDTLARGPTRIAQDLVVALDAPAPLAGVQSALDDIEKANVGWRTRAGIASPLVGGPPSSAMMLNVSAFLLTLTTVGALIISRIVLALLLAIAPVMAGFVLFGATRGLIEGWLRAMIGFALLPLAVLTLCAVELAVLEPLLAQMLEEQARGKFEAPSVTGVGLVVIVFSLAIVAAARALGSIARGLRLPDSQGRATETEPAASSSSSSVPGARAVVTAESKPEIRNPIAAVLESAARRDSARTELRTVAGELRATHGGPAPLRAPAPAALGSARSPHFVAPRRHDRLPRASRASSRRDL